MMIRSLIIYYERISWNDGYLSTQNRVRSLMEWDWIRSIFKKYAIFKYESFVNNNLAGWEECKKHSDN